MHPPNMAQDATWRNIFAHPQIAAASIAATYPDHGLIASNQSGPYQLYGWDVPTGTLHPRTDLADGVIFGGISPDGAYIYYFDPQRGHYVRMPFTGGTSATDITPELPPYQSPSISQSLNGRLLGFSTTSDAQTRFYTLAVAADGTLSPPTLLYTSSGSGYGPWLDYDATIAVIATTEPTGTSDHALMAFPLIAKGGEDAQKIRILQDEGADMVPVAFAPLPGDTRLLATTDAIGVVRPMIWDVATGDRVDLPFDDLDGDIGAWGWSPDGTRLLLFRVHHAHYQLYVFDLKRSTLTALDHPAGAYFGGFFRTDDEIAVVWTDPAHPAHVITLDASSGKRNDTLIAPTGTADISAWRSITFPSGGGSTIQAWLATPDPAVFGEGPYPTVLHAHDGPFDVQLPTFNAEVAAWLAHGVAWVSVNYRGSTTFGPEHQGSIIGILGHREIDDLVAARTYLIAQGITAEDQVLLSGRGYGGFLTLQALGRQPEGWAGGIAIDPIVDWAAYHHEQSMGGRAYIEMLFGGNPSAYAKLYAASSPQTYADAVEAPLLLISKGHDRIRAYVEQVQQNGIAVSQQTAGADAAATMQIILQWADDTLTSTDR